MLPNFEMQFRNSPPTCQFPSIVRNSSVFSLLKQTVIRHIFVCVFSTSSDKSNGNWSNLNNFNLKIPLPFRSCCGLSYIWDNQFCCPFFYISFIPFVFNLPFMFGQERLFLVIIRLLLRFLKTFWPHFCKQKTICRNLEFITIFFDVLKFCLYLLLLLL